jgi:hypothetical protein
MGTDEPGRRLGNLPVESERTEYLTAVQDSGNSIGEGTGFVIQVEGLETSQGGKEMLKDVPLIGIFVDDQEGALDFYTNELGQELGEAKLVSDAVTWAQDRSFDSG